MSENAPRSPEQLVLDLEVVPDEELERWAAVFEVALVDKMAVGAERYGARAYLGVDQLDMAMDELVDFGNYVKMMYVKLGLIRDFLTKHNVPLGTVLTK